MQPNAGELEVKGVRASRPSYSGPSALRAVSRFDGWQSRGTVRAAVSIKLNKLVKPCDRASLL